MKISETIIEGCKNNSYYDQMSFFDETAPYIKNICLRYINHNHEADSLMKSIYLHIFSSIKTYNVHTDIDKWLKVFVIKECIRHIQKTNVALFSYEENTLSDTNLKQDVINRNFTEFELQQILNKIPAYEALIFKMKIIDELTISEIEGLLPKDSGSVESTLKNAKQSILKNLSI